jgi:hypothetical protein
MLRGFTILAGSLLLVLSGYAAFAGWPTRFILFPVIPGLAMTLGVLFEGRRYKTILDTVPAGNWRDTGERFVDAETKRAVAVYSDPGTGKRVYIWAPQSASPSTSSARL